MAVIESGSSADLASVNASKQMLVSTSARVRSGVYVASSGLITLQAAAHAATAGFNWLLNPLASGKNIAIRRIEADFIGVALAAVITRITIERMTFTGVNTATLIPPAKVATSQANPVGLFTAATTGITPTAGNTAYAWFAMAVITAAGIAEPVESSWEPAEDGMLVLAQGEGIVIRQPDVGVATDPRRAIINLAWEEF